MIISVVGTRGFPFIQGGVEKHCESLYTKFNNQYQFLVYRRKPYVTSNDHFPNITFIDLPSTKKKGVEAAFHSFLAALRSCYDESEIVHFHNIGPGFFAFLPKVFGKKIVLTYHSPNYEHSKWGTIAKFLLKTGERMSLHYSDAIIFVNKFQMEKYSIDIRRKSFYIPNGIPNVIPSKSTQYIESLGLSTQNYILSVGRITPEKGFHILIEAFEQLKSEMKLVIAGGVEAESEYMKQINTLVKTNRVVFTGYVYGEKLNQLYSHARLFVLPSYNEGFPLVLLEAMSYGLDVLCSDIPATHLIELDEDDYFEKGNTTSLATHLRRKLTTSQTRCYDLAEYNWDEIAKQVMEVYKGLKG